MSKPHAVDPGPRLPGNRCAPACEEVSRFDEIALRLTIIESAHQDDLAGRPPALTEWNLSKQNPGSMTRNPVPMLKDDASFRL